MAASPAQTEPAKPASAGVDLGAFLAGSGGVGLILILSVAARLMTHDVIADGPYDSYVRSVAIAAVSAIIVAALLAWQFTPAYVWAAAGLILTLLPGDTWHYARLWSVGQFAQEEVVFESTFSGAALDPARWESDLGPGATLAVADGTVRVQTPAGAIGWLEPRFDLEPPIPRPWHPAALRERQPDYTITWETRFKLAGQFYILIEALNRDGRLLLLQARPGDWHLTHPTAEGPGPAVGFEIRDPVPSPSEWHQLTLKFGPSGTSLAIDGREVWSGIPLEFLKRVRFGETRSDELHGGEMEVRRVRISRTINPDPEIVGAAN